MRLHRFCLAATRLPHSPPRRHLLIGGLWGLKNRIPFKGKPFAHPIRYGCFLHGAISLEIATDILSILPPILTGSPVSLIPARSVLPAMSPGSAWEEAQPGCFAPGGLGRVGNDGREGGPSLLCAGLLKAVKAWNRQWPAMQRIATGRAVAAVSMRKGEPSVISRAFSP